MYTGTLLEFLNMGSGEIILIMAVVLLLFGGKKLPELARGLGKGIRDFKDASEGVKREIHRNINSLELDEELKKEEEAEALRKQGTAIPTQTLEEQMYPTVPVNAQSINRNNNGNSITDNVEGLEKPEYLNRDKDATPLVSTDIAATAEKTEKDKI